MGLVVVVLLVALVVGRLAGGSLQRLGRLPLRHRRLVLLAVLAQLLGGLVGGPAHALGLVASAALVVAFLVANRVVRGTGLVALGLLSNALVIGANGAMPVSADAAGRAGIGTQDLLIGADPRHVLASEGTRLPWLGDVVPVPLPLRPEVVSAGDVLVAAGLAQLVVSGMLLPRRALPRVPSESAPRVPARRAKPDAASRRALPPLPGRRSRRELPRLPEVVAPDRDAGRGPVHLS